MTGAAEATGVEAELFTTMAATTRAFLDAYLRGDLTARAWLEAGTPGALLDALLPVGDVPSWSLK